MDFLDLKHVQNTVVGDEFLRGISGGQKKRVTIGVELVKESNLLLMDEPTNGLDSSISLEVSFFLFFFLFLFFLEFYIY